MRRFPFFVAPLLGLVVLYFMVKVLFVVLIGAALVGLASVAFRGLSTGRGYSPMHVASMRQRQPVPIDARRSEPAFDWMQQNRIIEVI